MRSFGLKQTSVILGIGLVVLVHMFLLAPGFRGDIFDSEKASQYGEFLGGYLGTIVSICTLVIVLITYETAQKEQKKKSFEDRFFQYLSLYESGIFETNIDDSNGKRAYTNLVNRWRKIHRLVIACNDDNKLGLSTSILLRVSFYILQNGASFFLREAEDMSFNKIPKEEMGVLKATVLRKLKEERKQAQGAILTGSHTSLSIFFRQLYQIYVFIDTECPDEKDKEYYGKIVRSCLTMPQQVLLAINILSGFGIDWKKRGLLKKFNPIKNIPKGTVFVNVNRDLTSMFSGLIFEFDEVSRYELDSIGQIE